MVSAADRVFWGAQRSRSWSIEFECTRRKPFVCGHCAREFGWVLPEIFCPYCMTPMVELAPDADGLE
jgi:hypothetical protein